jgi:hypothetical protein
MADVPDYPKLDAHPWRIFLRARKDAIDWLAESGEPDDRIATALSLFPQQVERIRKTKRDDI